MDGATSKEEHHSGVRMRLRNDERRANAQNPRRRLHQRELRDEGGRVLPQEEV